MTFHLALLGFELNLSLSRALPVEVEEEPYIGGVGEWVEAREPIGFSLPSLECFEE